MRIEFDPTNPDEAAAVRAMLTAMHPTPDLSALAEPIKDYQQFIGRGMRLATTTNGETLQVHDGDKWVETPVTEVVLPEPDLDSNGEPWDARIHSTPPTTNKDGTWRAKRGVKAEEIAAVRAEREQAYDTEVTPEGVAQVREKAAEVLAGADLEQIDPPAPVEEQSAPPAPNAPVGEQSAPPAPPTPLEAAREELVAESREYMAVPTPPPAPDSPIATGGPSFLDVMKAITAAQKDGKIDTAKVKELCAAVGAGESTMGLNGPDNGDKRGAFMAALEETING